MNGRSDLIPWLAFAGFAFLTAAVYWPALGGGFLFDDRYYYTDSPDIHVTTLHLGDWIRAALSQTGSNQFRSLSMLTFAANYYFTGLDPFWPKLTNVVIHLLNGLLLFLLLRELFQLWRCVGRPTGISGGVDNGRLNLTAATIAGAWLLLPINLTGVAYVSQRLESLATVFVFLGLLWYFAARRRHYSGGAGAMIPLSLILCTALGYTAKESAVVLPLYVACAEFAITRFRNADGKVSRPVLWTLGVVLLLPLLLGLAWIATWVFDPITHFRSFSTGERLLTECRVLVAYIDWTLLPSLNSLTFYHDDFAVSHGLLDPPTTALSILALGSLVGVAIWQRSARPLFCLGILWFFAGHVLTATVIPLELVFEHRNYFPSVGLLLAATSLCHLEPIARIRGIAIIAAAILSFYAFTTFLRSEEWSHPLRLALSEASKRPNSPRAQYELARTLIMAAGNDMDSPLIDRSLEILKRDAFRPETGIAPLQALIYVSARAHREIDPLWWQGIIDKINGRALSLTDVEAIVFLFRCQMRGDCPRQREELLDVFTSALVKTHGNIFLTSAYADFAISELGDAELAIRMARDAIAARPQVPLYRANLARILIAAGRLDAANAAIEDLAGMDRAGSLDATVAQLRQKLAAARAAVSRDLQPLPSNR